MERNRVELIGVALVFSPLFAWQAWYRARMLAEVYAARSRPVPGTTTRPEGFGYGWFSLFMRAFLVALTVVACVAVWVPALTQ